MHARMTLKDRVAMLENGIRALQERANLNRARAALLREAAERAIATLRAAPSSAADLAAAADALAAALDPLPTHDQARPGRHLPAPGA